MAEAKKATKKTAKAAKKEEAGAVTEPMIVELKAGEAAEIDEIAQENEATEAAESQEEAKTTKAGKRSAKAQREADEEQAKEDRKAKRAEAEATGEKPIAKPKPKTRSRLERAGKKFREAAKNIEADKQYSLADALKLAAKTSTTKFDATVELHIRLGVDPRQADQNIRDNLVLPAGTGKSVKVAVFAEADDAAAAKKAGADFAGSDDFLQQLDKQKIDFDVLIATPTVMPKLGKYARLLGPKGLMPNPKSGTVTPDVAKAVQQAKAGRVEYRVDSTGIVHVGIGKVSFTAENLLLNAQAIVGSIKSNKPASVKGTYVKSAYVATTMGPSIPLNINEL